MNVQRVEENAKVLNDFKSNRLSRYKTYNQFENYGEITSVDDYIFYLNWAKENEKDVYILGNGSNTLFANKTIKSLVLKNNIKPEIKCISSEDNLYEVSSSTSAIDVLKYCYKNSLDSFYYLASVPATIGGALAMNAGMGIRSNKSIYDFVDSVTYVDEDNNIKKISKEDMKISHRNTMFTGQQEKFILSAIFKFPNADFKNENPIKERILWSKEYQDNVAPNCGSVFKISDYKIMAALKKVGFKIGKASYSSKTGNWINNKSENPLPILILIRITKLFHLMLLKKCKEEVIIVK